MDLQSQLGRADMRLASISEPSDNLLRLVIQQALPVGPVVSTELGSVREVLFDGSTYELQWERYVAYFIRDESFSPPMQEPRFLVRSASTFLDYVAATTIATDDYPGPLRHWTLKTTNHIVEVASWLEPAIRRL